MPSHISGKKSWKIIGISCLLTAVLVVLYGKNLATPTFNRARMLSLQSITPTPYPLYELTIPYLRERTYTSTLGKRTLYSQYFNYTSYLTRFTSDGLRINGLLTIPTGTVPKNGWPAIVLVHGYIPPKQYVTTENYESYVDFLAKSGFVVFKIDLRGHGNSQGEARGAYYSADYIIDTLNAYAALQKASFVNPKRIGLWGHSMGGNVVMRAFAAQPTIPAVSIWAGAVYSYTDMQKYGISDSSYQRRPSTTLQHNTRQRLFDLYGSSDSTGKFWQDLAPTNFLTDLKGALQLHHSTDDAV